MGEKKGRSRIFRMRFYVVPPLPCLTAHTSSPPLCDRFMEEKLRQKDTMIEKLRLKNSTIKAQIGKMEHMLAHKEEMGEVRSCLHTRRRWCCTWWA